MQPEPSGKQPVGKANLRYVNALDACRRNDSRDQLRLGLQVFFRITGYRGFTGGAG